MWIGDISVPIRCAINNTAIWVLQVTLKFDFFKMKASISKCLIIRAMILALTPPPKADNIFQMASYI